LGAEARVNHERKVERLLSFAFENFNFLRIAFFDNLKGFDRQVCGGRLLSSRTLTRTFTRLTSL